MVEPGPWRGDDVRRGLAATLGKEVADELQARVDETVRLIDASITFSPPEDRNDALAFVGLCIAGHMRTTEPPVEPEGMGV